ncbi:MAG: hypothetical protein HWD59_10115 [Coxiellaceae bacterium]|nr:MAG: hypothetical protein HWD59_10115 [Coxiellaceae bacterium]
MGLPGDDTVDLTGQGKGSICPVEVSFPGLFSILKQLPKGRMFEYSHKNIMVSGLQLYFLLVTVKDVIYYHFLCQKCNCLPKQVNIV